MFAQIWCTDYMRTVSGEKKDDTRFSQCSKNTRCGLNLIPPPPPPQFTSCSFKLISSFLLGSPCDQNNGGCDYLCVNLHFSKGPRCVYQKDMNLKGDGKTCEKGECFVGPLKKYIFVSGMLRHIEF